MSNEHEPRAVEIATAHVRAWASHDFDTARGTLAPDVRVTAATTAPYPPDTDLAGADAYMEGLAAYAQPILPGSLRILASTGDQNNALLTLTVTMAGGPFGAGAQAPCSRLYLIDDNGKIKTEKIIFYVAGPVNRTASRERPHSRPAAAVHEHQAAPATPELSARNVSMRGPADSTHRRRSARTLARCRSRSWPRRSGCPAWARRWPLIFARGGVCAGRGPKAAGEDGPARSLRPRVRSGRRAAAWACCDRGPGPRSCGL